MKRTPFTLADLGSTPRNGIDSGLEHRPMMRPGGLRDHVSGNDKETRWTNEKHDAYLDSMERSFVQQLQGSRSRIRPSCGGYVSITGAGGACRHPSPNQAIHSKGGEMKPESIEVTRSARADKGRHSGIPSSLQHSPKSSNDDGNDVSEHSGQNF
ncbi:hypothetical protein MLD38_013559 [Melastoma candidum]|uniref:Uncharacterized protein n=1 Tax=Melastoma candidum TaxID=119954 RepID=A0ACB9RIG0_9MYRT|nr:hypothetical protein MLD38_013559 [Melastoma candidum]